MSRIPEIGKGYANLPTILDEYKTALEEAESIIQLKGKLLEHANRENPSWQFYYDQKRLELKSLVDYMEMHVQRVRGKLFRSYTETSNRELSDRAKDKYIDNEKAYLDVYELLLEVKEIYGKYQSVCEAFQSRGYALNNITKIRVAALEDVVL